VQVLGKVGEMFGELTHHANAFITSSFLMDPNCTIVLAIECELFRSARSHMVLEIANMAWDFKASSKPLNTVAFISSVSQPTNANIISLKYRLAVSMACR